MRAKLTASVAATYGAVGRRGGVATAVADLRVEQALAVAEGLAEQVLNAPEAACGDGSLFGGHVARLRFRAKREDWRASGEGAQES